jgi:hypothetical protein
MGIQKCLQKLFMFDLVPSHHLKRNKKHWRRLRERGLDYFVYYVLPAAGPKAFVSSGFEYQLHKQIEEGTLKSEKWFVGGSTGALRSFAFISSLITQIDHTELLKNQYCEMYYQKGTTPDCLYKFMLTMFDICAPVGLLEPIINHDQFHIAVMVSELRPAFTYFPWFMIRGILAAFVLGNFISPSLLHIGKRTTTMFVKRQDDSILPIDSQKCSSSTPCHDLHTFCFKTLSIY